MSALTISTPVNDVVQEVIDASRAVVAMTFSEARDADMNGTRLLYCNADVLNPCYDGRSTDIHGKHWGGGDACTACTLRSTLARFKVASPAELGTTL